MEFKSNVRSPNVNQRSCKYRKFGTITSPLMPASQHLIGHLTLSAMMIVIVHGIKFSIRTAELTTETFPVIADVKRYSL